MEFIIIAIVAGLIPAAIAANKGRSFFVWWIYGTLLFVVALIHSLVMAKTGKAVDDTAIMAGNLKCPHCAEWIKREAKVCRFCGRDVEPSVSSANATA